MGIFDFFSNKNSAQKIATLDTNPTDAFADRVSLEIRAAASEAIKRDLQQSESQFMRTVLQDSFFLLESLTIRPVSTEVARKFETFIKRHESIDSNFKIVFFQNVLQPEYRSSRGSTVKVPKNFSVSLDFSELTATDLSQEESFRVNLRGKSKKFEISVSLTGPHHKASIVANDYGNVASASTAVNLDAAGSLSSGRAVVQDVNAVSGRYQLHLTIEDASGIRTLQSMPPLLLGKTASSPLAQASVSNFVGVDSVYVSRQQLVFTEILGTVYFFVPAQASLTAVNASGQHLKPMYLYPLRPHLRERLRLGIDPQQSTGLVKSSSPGEFAVLEFSLDEDSTPPQGTPVPRMTA